jgi:alkylation response protein AidB-like acyl-CoA dehydrogenase
MNGFERGRNIDKLGLKTQDTVELFFDDVRVPKSNRLGEEGDAFRYLTANLPQERLAVALGAVASAEAAIIATVEYVRERNAFGTPISSFQNTRFELAACKTDAAAGRALLEAGIAAYDQGSLGLVESAMAKIFCTEMQGRVVDRCLQLFGGYGYVREYPIARMYVDARVGRIYGGTTEVLKTIIAKSMDL